MGTPHCSCKLTRVRPVPAAAELAAGTGGQVIGTMPKSVSSSASSSGGGASSSGSLSSSGASSGALGLAGSAPAAIETAAATAPAAGGGDRDSGGDRRHLLAELGLAHDVVTTKASAGSQPTTLPPPPSAPAGADEQPPVGAGAGGGGGGQGGRAGLSQLCVPAPARLETPPLRSPRDTSPDPPQSQLDQLQQQGAVGGGGGGAASIGPGSAMVSPTVSQLAKAQASLQVLLENATMEEVRPPP